LRLINKKKDTEEALARETTRQVNKKIEETATCFEPKSHNKKKVTEEEDAVSLLVVGVTR
jgi:hypothetical protein